MKMRKLKTKRKGYLQWWVVFNQIIELLKQQIPYSEKMFQQCFSSQNKNPCIDLIFRKIQGFWSTQSRDRTGMEVNPLVFETSASTNSAIWAFVCAKVIVFLRWTNRNCHFVQKNPWLLRCSDGSKFVVLTEKRWLVLNQRFCMLDMILSW